MQKNVSDQLPEIPVIATGADFPMATLLAEEARAHQLIDGAIGLAPGQALKALDAVSRRWLARWNNAHLDEIDRIAARLDRPGAYYLSVNYEWGCTVAVHAAPQAASARLTRVLDWRTPGLGRHIIAATVTAAVGPFVTMTWPGYTGVLQAMAPGRFAAALNQAPMPRRGGGVYPFDWLANKITVWRTPHATPAHVLRDVFEQAPDFAAARRHLSATPIAAPAIFSLAGTTADELCVIERTEDGAHVHDGAGAAANAWQAPGWDGRERGHDSAGRARQMMHDVVDAECDFDERFCWLKPPILNDRTRLVMQCDAEHATLLAQGYEADGPATLPLRLSI